MSSVLLLIAKIYFAVMIAVASIAALAVVSCLKGLMLLWLSLKKCYEFLKFTNVSRP